MPDPTRCNGNAVVATNEMGAPTVLGLEANPSRPKRREVGITLPAIICDNPEKFVQFRAMRRRRCHHPS